MVLLSASSSIVSNFVDLKESSVTRKDLFLAAPDGGGGGSDAHPKNFLFVCLFVVDSCHRRRRSAIQAGISLMVQLCARQRNPILSNCQSEARD